MSTRLSELLPSVPEGTAAKARPPFEQSPEYETMREKNLMCRLRKAGLLGAYAKADCRLGRDVLARAMLGKGTYLFGLPGRGKTYAAAAAIRMAVETGQKAKLVTTKSLLEQVKAEYDGGPRVTLVNAEKCSLLALDDLGMEKPTEWAMETLTALIDARVAAGLPTIITSNYNLGGLRDRWGGMAGARIASRIAGACERVEVVGEDRRLA